MKIRTAARVVLLNAAGEVFLLHARDLHDDSRRWWLTCGGGAEMGETPQQTAARELAEETGLVCEPAELLGPLATRRAVIEFTERTLHQDEVFFGLVSEDEFDLADAVWTEVEKRSIVGGRWWSQDELRRTTATVYPSRLTELMDLVRSGTAPAVPLVLD
ncbi:NUDIX hydrolase [Brevibacterium sp. CS2]|uniref:NUDIX hydrolase n=1 Tax=Brevibacterium sp. CS2 TaxID=2575923 RepID=UPI0010C78338|nr:NUDIX domain-containing protein [Brevibacterium sp. CS2]QCP05914.1 NUDIX domain-containing protein [Brevibacterium sp. CS2]